ADYDLLEILEANDLQTLFVKVVSGEITFEKLDERKVNIHSKSSLIRASHEEYVLRSTFGDLKLVKLYNMIVKSSSESLMDRESFKAQETKVTSKPQDIQPQRRNIFADDEEKKVETKPKRVSIFLDDDEEPTPPKIETPKAKIADIPNEKVQEDLEFASQKLTETKVDKKPVLETLWVEEETKQVQEQEKPTVTQPIVEEVSVEKVEQLAQEEPIQEEAQLQLEEEHDEALKLAGITLEEPIEDEASIDELLALADEQEKEAQETLSQKLEENKIEQSAEEEELKLEELHEEEETLATIPLEEDKDDESAFLESLSLSDEEETLTFEEPQKEEEPIMLDESQIDKGLLIEEDEEVEEIGSLLLGDEEEPLKIEESEVDEGLLLGDNEEIEEIGDLLLSDDEEPVREEIKEEPQEEVEAFDDLFLADDEEPVREEIKEEPLEELEAFDDLLLGDDEAPKRELSIDEPKEVVEDFDDLLVLDDTPKATPVKEETTEELNEIKDLLLEIDEAPKKVEKLPVKDYNYPDTIEIDLDEYGEMIGLGANDYQEFLNEFIDKSIIYDEDLRSDDRDKREEVLNELYSISQSLQLPYLEDILADMLERPYVEEELVDIYYDCLAKVTTVAKPQEVETPVSETKVEQAPVHIEEPQEEEAPAAGGYGVLSFEGIKPIHFDFRLEEAAEDLSLPVDLIEEFVNDFIEQAIEEKETFIKAYAKGDMDTIQKTGHKLKGASSNLRIIPLSETLEEIQHCENPARFEPLLKKYWGQFLSFKLFMENISHK
ncbi:MAG: Hpt domain-containing protein, partial [Campylobacterales bacterium]|nr:Hpt domain-containing protein [Campylobacterales bacterium]